MFEDKENTKKQTLNILYDFKEHVNNQSLSIEYLMNLKKTQTKTSLN